MLTVAALSRASLDAPGVALAVASGALTSALGYIVWYTALPQLKVSTAATSQLSVPVLAALGGIVFLGEAMTLRLVVASTAILGGIACVVLGGSEPVKD
jgi:drug/metabolite transporter (DMT)-like permease